MQQTSLRHHDGVSTSSTRSFATQKKRKHNKKGGNTQHDAYKQQIKSQQPSSSIIGMRPGQTSFSPPVDKTFTSPSPMTTKSPIQSTHMTSNKSKHAQSNTVPTNNNNNQKMPLINPSFDAKEEDQINHTDNKDHAHTYPSISTYTQEIIDVEDNILRQQFLREGILPPPTRPEINKSSKGNNTTSSSMSQSSPPPDIPEAHPSGISHANPEDILDMASMYDPSIHLPDKPNFNSPMNRMKYESGTALTDELISYIGVRGPITVAEYMRRVLRDGRYGYYTSKGSRSGKKKNGGSSAAVLSGDDADEIQDDDNDWDLDESDDIGDDTSNTEHHVGGEHVIGSGGDFITAPEVSQLFGESLLVWLMTQYQTLNSPSKIQIIEIGPGKGTLICDVIRSAISTFPDFASALTSPNTEVTNRKGAVEGEEKDNTKNNNKVAIGVHLVELANGMRARQRESIRNLEKEKTVSEKGYSFQFSDTSIDEEDNQTTADESEPLPLKSKDEKSTTICVSWHDVLSSVPTHDAISGEPIPTFIICQELVDALPIHSFQKIEGNAWRERLVDVAIRDESEASGAAKDIQLAAARRYASAESNNTTAESPSSSNMSSNEQSTLEDNKKKIPRLRLVLPPDTTPALRSMMRVNSRGSSIEDNPSAQSLNSLPVGSIVEACPEGLLLAQDIADRIEKCHGGAALIIDYGGDGSSGGDSLRGFYKHTQVHALSRPGEVDVTADVDFGALREAVNQRMSLEESILRKRRQEGESRSAAAGNETTYIAEEETPDESNKKHKLRRPEAFGPITQGNFLAQMGIVQRVEKKIEDSDTTDEEAYEIYSAMERLMVPEEMGERYKVLAIAAKKDGLFPPPGF